MRGLYLNLHSREYYSYVHFAVFDYISVPMYNIDTFKESGGVSFFHFLHDNDSRFFGYLAGFSKLCNGFTLEGGVRVLVTALLL